MSPDRTGPDGTSPAPDQRAGNPQEVGRVDANADANHDAAAAMAVREAVCRLQPVGESGVRGTVHFERSDEGLRVHGRIEGLTPGKHGFHVHQFGDVTDTAKAQTAGGHFSPEGHPHGEREAAQRHVGDLGNVEANEQGVAEIDFVDNKIRLGGKHSILGRALIVHAKADTYGQPTGDAGDRVAAGVIGIAEDGENGAATSDR